MTNVHIEDKTIVIKNFISDRHYNYHTYKLKKMNFLEAIEDVQLFSIKNRCFLDQLAPVTTFKNPLKYKIP